MNATDHLAKAKDYIARGEDFYRKAADEIIAAQREDPTLSFEEVGRRIGKSRDYARRLVQARTNDARARGALVVDWDSGSNKREEVVRAGLSDPERRQRALAELPTEKVEEIIEDAHSVARDRMRARRTERSDKTPAPTVRDLTGGEEFDPSESWADNLIMRVNKNARELGHHVSKWGLVVNALGEDTAFEYLLEAERHIADVRVALQERVHDREQAEV